MDTACQANSGDMPTFTLPMPAQRFVEEHWQRKPLLMRQCAHGLDNPDPEMLATLAGDDEVESRIVRGHDEGPWAQSAGPFEAADFAQMPAENWTLLVQSVDHYLTDVSLLLDSFRFLPAWRIEDIMVSYATRGGGVGPHFDRYDVFLLQARGTRRWKLGQPCDASTALKPHPDLKLLADMPIVTEYVLGPGDGLYLPPGIAHWGVAEDNDCVTWSVGLRAPRRGELLARIVDEALESGAGDGLFADRGRDADTPDVHGGIGEADLLAMQEQANELVTDSARRRALYRLLSEPRQDSLHFAVDVDRIRERAPAAGLVRHGGCRMLLQNDGAAATLWVNGEALPLTGAQIPLARLLASQRLCSRESLAVHTATAEPRQLLEQLEDSGHVIFLE